MYKRLVIIDTVALTCTCTWDNYTPQLVNININIGGVFRQNIGVDYNG